MGSFNAEEELEPFVVTVKGGRQFELPSLGELTFEQVEALQNLNLEGGLEEIKRIFTVISPEFAAEGLPKMGAIALGKMMNAWQDDAGVSLGEFSASVNSSQGNTGARSKPTSSPKGSAFVKSAPRASRGATRS